MENRAKDRRMKGRIPLPQRLVSVLAVAVLTALSGTIPVLDVWPDDCRTGIQSEGHPEAQGYPHNHLICIQHQANHWAPGADLPAAPAILAVQALDPLPLGTVPAWIRTLVSPRPRSPPLA
jgi:hypothetical protein